MDVIKRNNIYIDGVICSGPSLLHEGREFVLLMKSIADGRIVLGCSNLRSLAGIGALLVGSEQFHSTTGAAGFDCFCLITFAFGLVSAFVWSGVINSCCCLWSPGEKFFFFHRQKTRERRRFENYGRKKFFQIFPSTFSTKFTTSHHFTLQATSVSAYRSI